MIVSVQSFLLLSLVLHVVNAFLVTSVVRPTLPHHCSVCYQTSKGGSFDEKAAKVNGATVPATPAEQSNEAPRFNTSHYAELLLTDITDAVQEVSRRMNDGSALLFENITAVMYDKLAKMKNPDAEELSEYVGKFATKIQSAQQEEMERQLMELEKKIVEPLEQVAFSDAPLFVTNQKPPLPEPKDDAERVESLKRGLVLAGRNSTLGKSSRLRSSELIRNLNVAPLYFSIALLYRWIRKAASPPTYLLSALKTIANMVRPKSPPWQIGAGRENTHYEDFMRDAEAMQSGWKRTGQIASKGPWARKWAILRRSAEVWSYFSSFYLKDRRINRTYQKGKWSEQKFKEERSKLGAELTQNLLRLGPTFIKLGQLFSTRIDILPKEYIEQLKLLQDNVPPFDGETAVRIIEAELGRPINQVFDTFERKALAGASLGQVHIATKGNRVFAVKVQRQHLKELFEVDLGQLRQLAVFADTLDVTSEGGLFDRNTQRDWLSVFEESKRLLYEEVDYTNELRNAERFRENFQGPRFQHVVAPKTYEQFSTERVLCMEYLPGVKITDLQKIAELGLDPVDISIKSAQAFFEQLFRHGFFHSDPHPGNIAVRKGPDGSAQLIFYDFGMMDSFGQVERKGFVDLAFAVYYDADVKDACDALERMGMLRTGPDLDRIAIERVGQNFIDRFQETMKKNLPWEHEMTPEEQTKINRARRKQLGEEFLSLNRDSPFVFPPTWTFVLRAFFSLDGIGKTLNPRYDIVKIMLPYLKELIDLKDGSAVKTTLLRIGKRVGLRPVDIHHAVTQPRRTAHVEDIVTRLERGDFKLRVRALEVERQNERNELVLRNSYEAVILGLFFQGGVCLLTVGSSLRGSHGLGKLLLGASSILAIRVPMNLLKLRNLAKYNERYGMRS